MHNLMLGFTASQKTCWAIDNTLDMELAELSGKTNECTKTS